MSVVDAAMTREVLRDISKRPLDIGQLNVHVTQGVVYLGGRVDKLRDYHLDIDLIEEINMIVRLLKQKAGIRDVLCEVELGGGTLSERVDPQRRKQSYH
jgi:hypothetical protein